MSDFDGFLIPNPDGPGWSAPLPGRFTGDGLYVVVADPEGRLRRYQTERVRVDVSAWRRRNVIAGELTDVERKSIASRVRSLFLKVGQLRREGRINTAAKENLMLDLRALSEVIADEDLGKELWQTVDSTRGAG